MKAIFKKLWNLEINIITTEKDENEIQSFSDLAKCEMVVQSRLEMNYKSELSKFLDFLDSRDMKYMRENAKSGSVYITIYVEKWIVIRFADHKRVYFHENFSVHPGGLDTNKIINEIKGKIT